MITGLGIGLVGADDLFKNVTHSHRTCSRGMKVNFREGFHNLKQNALLDHEFHFFTEFEALQNPLNAGRICRNELQKIRIQIVAIAYQLFQRDALCVIERHPAGTLDHFLQLIRCHALDLGGRLQDFFNGGVLVSQDAVKTADNRHRDDDAAVFLRSVGTTGFICDTFYKVDLAIYVCCQCDVVHIASSLS